MKRQRTILPIALIVALLLTALPWHPGHLVAAGLLMGLLPGLALVTALWPSADNLDLSSRFLLAVAASYGLTISLLLLLAFIQIPLNQFSVAGSLAGLTLILTTIAWRRQPPRSPTPYSRSPLPFTPWLLLILLSAAFFRLTNVGYSDHQGDEADILLRAVSLVYGDVDALLTHSKGPGEILLLTGVGTLTGQFDELTARVLFSIAGTVSIGLIFWLGCRLLSLPVGVIAGLLAAIDGVFVSYARTAQYQSVVLLLTLAAIGCFYQFQQTHGQERRWHFLGTFLLAASFLVHFETVLLLPVAAYLSIAHRLPALAKPPSISRFTFYVLRFTFYALRPLWPSLLIFISLTALFYVPFFLHPKVGATGTYLENRIGGGDLPPFNNLAHFFYFESMKYNSIYYMVLFNLLLLAACFLTWIKSEEPARPRAATDSTGRALLLPTNFMRPRLSVPLLLCLGSLGSGLMLSLAEWPKLSALLVALGLAIFFVWVTVAPSLPLPLRTLWLWIGPPLWGYVFLVNRPGKHHYIFLGALTLLVGWAGVYVWRWSQRRVGVDSGIATPSEGTATLPPPSLPLIGGGAKTPPSGGPGGAVRWLTFGLGLLLLLLFANHTWLVLLRSDLEYMLTYPEHKSALYPTDAAYPYGTRIGFGYPFRLGWQTVGQLKRTGHLTGTWAGNDDGNAPNWYMLNTPQTLCYPDYVLRGEITYKGDDNFDVPFIPENFGYVPRYRIWGNDRLRMTILAFDPLAETGDPIDLYETDSFAPPVTAADFAATIPAPTPPARPPEIILEPAPVLGEGSEIKQNAPPEYLERAQTLAGRVALLGYDVAEQYAVPGSVLPLTLHWYVQEILSLRYKVFIHLIGPDGTLWAQADDFPVCGTFHANAWGVGSTVRDRYLINLPPDMPPDDYRLVVGMYEPDLNLRLNYFDIANNEQGNSVAVGTVTVEQ